MHSSAFITLIPQWLRGEESVCQAGDAGSIPVSGSSPEEGNGGPLQYSCLENPTDRGAWHVMVRGVEKSWAGLKQLST